MRNMDAVAQLSIKTGMPPHWSLFGCTGALCFKLYLLQHEHDAPLQGGMKQPFICSAELCYGSFGVMSQDYLKNIFLKPLVLKLCSGWPQTHP